MPRKGPCYHCGARMTPLWRYGPPDKPVLCNACGSRWRLKGTLENYTPKHALLSMAIENSQDDQQGLTSSNNWHHNVPSKKRSLSNQYCLSTVGRLQRDLCNLLQQSEFANLIECPEDVLTYDYDRMESDEIGLGGILLKSPFEDQLSVEEKEASSDETLMESSSLNASMDNNLEVSQAIHSTIMQPNSEPLEMASSSSSPNPEIETVPEPDQNIQETLKGSDSDECSSYKKAGEPPAADIFFMGTNFPPLDMFSATEGNKGKRLMVSKNSSLAQKSSFQTGASSSRAGKAQAKLMEKSSRYFFKRKGFGKNNPPQPWKLNMKHQPN